MKTELRIDPEFQSRIPPLTDAEFAQLEENILEAGKVYEPIVTWNDIIVDGHNRYKIVQKHPEIIWETREMDFADKWAAFDWMYANQLGRRNLTKEQYGYLKGKMYEARKHTHGGQIGNQNASKRSGQNDHFVKANKIREQLATELNTTPSDIRRSYEFSKGIDAIREDDPGLADSILEGKKKVLKSTVRDVGRSIPEVRGKIIEAIKEDRKAPKRRTKEEIKKDREDITQIEKYVEENRQTGGEVILTIHDFISDFKKNTEPYLKLVRRIVSGYADIIKENSDNAIKIIDEFLIDEINKIKEEIKPEPDRHRAAADHLSDKGSGVET